MKVKRDIFEIFEHDENFRYIMKRLLEASMVESFNSVLITKAEPGYPIVYSNPAFSELTGYEPHEVIGQSPSILQGRNTDQAVIERLNKDITEGKLFHGQAINYRKDGSPFVNRLRIRPIYDADGKLLFFAGAQNPV